MIVKAQYPAITLFTVLVIALSGCNHTPATNVSTGTNTLVQNHMDSTERTMTLAGCAKRIGMTAEEWVAWNTNYGYELTDSVTEKVCNNIAELMRRKKAAKK